MTEIEQDIFEKWKERLGIVGLDRTINNIIHEAYEAGLKFEATAHAKSDARMVQDVRTQTLKEVKEKLENRIETGFALLENGEILINEKEYRKLWKKLGVEDVE